MSLPRSAYVWLFLLILSVIGGRFLDLAERSRERTRAVAEYVPTASDFSAFIQAEANVRLAVYYQTLPDMPVASPFGGGRDLKQQRQKALSDATKLYRGLSKTATAPNLARRILILEHLSGKPLDEKLLTDDLALDLKAREKPAKEISDELTFWRALYAGQVPDPPLSAAAWEKRIRAMEIGFLEDRLLADLYTTVGDKQRTDLAESRLENNARAFVSRSLATNLPLILGFVLGVVLLGMYLYASLRGRWTVVHRVATRLATIEYGIFLDAFLAYLAIIFLSRLILSPLVAAFLPNPTREAALGITLLGQVIPAILATTYLFASLVRHTKAPAPRNEMPDTAPAHPAPLAEIGLTTNGRLLGNIVYGILGYCAALPLVAGLGALSRLIFQNNPNTAPNLALPLISSEKELAGRIVLFLLVAVSAPLFEEIFFRGALYSGLRTRFGWGLGVLLSAVLFAVVHPMQDWLPIFGLGVTFAVMREMRQSIVPCIVAHFLQNALTFFTLTNLFGG
jgi:membrane protease YdiL (CAAX protease family)